MPRQNRVTPLGELIATPERGLVYGNRGCLHDEQGRIRRRYATRRWIACRLEFKGWHRSPLMQPGKFTELFFLDEATAFAAGHRPCALCRREDYNRFNELLAGAARRRRHRSAAARRAARRHHEAATCPTAPSCFTTGEPWLVLGDALLRWTPGGYTERIARPAGRADGHHRAVAGRGPAPGLGGRGSAAAPLRGHTDRVTKPSAGLLRAIAVAAVLAGVGSRSSCSRATTRRPRRRSRSSARPSAGGSSAPACGRGAASRRTDRAAARGARLRLAAVDARVREQRSARTRSDSSSARSGARSSCTSG